MPAPKIATCCYCGTRAALVLRGEVRHELSCASCGAPLHDLKMLRADHAGARSLVRPSPVRNTHRKAPSRARDHDRRRRKKHPWPGRRLLEEVWDEIEDIFD